MAFAAGGFGAQGPGEMPAFRAKPGRARQARTSSKGLSALKGLRALSRARAPSVHAKGATRKAAGGTPGAQGRGGFKASAGQRVIVKTFVGRTTTARGVKAAAAHLNYLEREGAGEGGERAVAFDGQGDMTREQVAEFRQKMGGDRHHFRVIVSPENGAKLDLKDYAQEVVKQMESDLGTRLEWLGVVHRDTDNPHVHLVIRGVNDRGGDLVMSRKYLGHGMRHTAEDIATQRLGHRTEHEIAQAVQRELKAERFTALDRKIVEATQRREDGLVSTRDMPAAGTRAAQVRDNMIARLHYLEGTGLASQAGPGLWEIEPNLEARLKSLARQNDVQAQIHQRLAGRENDLATNVFDKDRPVGESVVGRVVAKAGVDELTDRSFLAVSATDGTIYYVPLSQHSERPGFEARVGSIVKVSTQPAVQVGPADRNIARVAGQAGGVYDPEFHKGVVLAEGRLPATASPDEYIQAHTKRLDAMASRGLVEKLPGGRWRVPENYLEQLKAPPAQGRDQGGIVQIDRQSLTDLQDQVKATGPTWLDRQIVEGTATPSEFSRSKFQSELAKAKADRLEELKARGLVAEGRDTPQQNFINALYENELAEAHARLGKEFGQAVPMAPGASFAGKLERVEQLSSGPHAVVADGQRFAVVPVSGNMAAQVGRQLSINLGHARAVSQALPTLQQVPIRYELARVQQLGLGH